MKIAIPTQDGLMIAPLFEKATGFLVLTIELGEIRHEEIRWMPDTQDQIRPLYDRIADCSTVIVRDTDDPSCLSLSENGITCIHTHESIITNIAVHFIENDLRKASGTCCCP